ncbi:unnamed protein product [Strongylus vulgaris]|uniref:DNA mismatch repair protein S5 domain-containing protein n=1 Tax=Strongylus vulgaris TaxID=40348 RepID=A0A3P7JQT8_STRVU|nr:unnamed protein product [Strongylus vulgaris]
MVGVVRCLPTEEVALMHSVDPKNTSAYVDIEFTGFVSSCEHGYGRSSPDRQFIYVNQRPVDYSKICRVINEVYQQYNRSQYPTLVLYITVPPEEIDVNVTPDKRMIFFEREKELLALIRSSFLATFHPLLGSYTSVANKITSNDNEKTINAVASTPKSSGPLSATSAFVSLIKSNSTKVNSPTYTPPQPKRSRTEDHNSSLSTGLKTLEAFAFKPLSRDALVEAIKTPSTSGIASNTIAAPSSANEEDVTPSNSFKNNLNELAHRQRTFSPSLTRNLSRGFEADIEKDLAVMEKMEKTMDEEESPTNGAQVTPNSAQEVVSRKRQLSSRNHKIITVTNNLIFH